MKTLVGISSGTSKSTGKPYYCLGVISPCDEFDNQYGSYGTKYDRIFVSAELFQRVKPQDFGKEIVFDYEVRGNRASVVGFKIK